MYEYTSALTPPKWPEDVLGKIDRDLAKRGETLYREQGCVTCHALTPYPTVQPKPAVEQVSTTGAFLQ